MIAPVDRHRNLHYLSREFRSSSAPQALKSLPPHLLEALLNPPATLAKWIRAYHPSLCDKPTLHVVVMGAAEQDGVDSGCWYSLLPWLLGNENLKVSVTLVGVDLFEDAGSGGRTGRPATFSSPAAQLAARHMPPAQLVPHTIEAYLASPAGQAPVDLFFAFNPGFEDEPSWLQPGNLDAVCRRGVPIGVASYCEHERVTEIEVLATAGFEAAPRHSTNPFAGVQTPVGQWGSSFWEIVATPPPQDFVPDPQRQQRLEQHMQFASHFLKVHGRTPQLEAGLLSELRIPGEAAPRHLVQLLTPFISVDRDTGELVEFDEEGHLERVTRKKLPAEFMARRPEGDFSFEAFDWTCEAFSRAQQLLRGDGPGVLGSVLEHASSAAQLRQEMAPPGSDEDEAGRLFPMSHDEMLEGVANLIRLSTGKDIDPEQFLHDMRAAGGIHGPTHEAWWNLFSHLEWDTVELTDTPERLEPAFEVRSKSGVAMPVVCEAYQYLPGDDRDELAEEAKAKLAKAHPDGVILVFKVMPYKEVAGHRYACGGLLYLRQQWRPFALCDSMRSLDDLLEQRANGFSFNTPDPRYAEDLGLSRALSLMTSGHDPNEPRRVLTIRQGDWVVEIPD